MPLYFFLLFKMHVVFLTCTFYKLKKNKKNKNLNNDLNVQKKY